MLSLFIIYLNDWKEQQMMAHRYEKNKFQQHKSVSTSKIIRPGTLMPRIKRIYMDRCECVSTVAPDDAAHMYGSRHKWSSVFYRTPTIIDDDKKPQINADERRFVHRETAFHNLFFSEQIENHENHPN